MNTLILLLATLSLASLRTNHNAHSDVTGFQDLPDELKLPIILRMDYRTLSAFRTTHKDVDRLYNSYYSNILFNDPAKLGAMLDDMIREKPDALIKLNCDVKPESLVTFFQNECAKRRNSRFNVRDFKMEKYVLPCSKQVMELNDPDLLFDLKFLYSVDVRFPAPFYELSFHEYEKLRSRIGAHNLEWAIKAFTVVTNDDDFWRIYPEIHAGSYYVADFVLWVERSPCYKRHIEAIGRIDARQALEHYNAGIETWKNARRMLPLSAFITTLKTKEQYLSVTTEKLTIYDVVYYLELLQNTEFDGKYQTREDIMIQHMSILRAVANKNGFACNVDFDHAVLLAIPVVNAKHSSLIKAYRAVVSSQKQ